VINEERLVELFKTLCLIDAPSLDEARSVEWTKQYLAQIPGIEVWEDNGGAKIGGTANNLFVKLPANTEGVPTIFFSAHFDTVEPTAGLVIEERDGVFYSASDTILGADDKSGVAPAIEAIQVLVESGEPHGDIYLLLSCAEEIGLKGAAAMELKDLNLTFGYVLDTGPPVGSFVNQTAFHDKLDITIQGKPAHAGKDPEKGINAIVVASNAISGMKMGRISPNTTANLGIISGGTGVNVVCPEVVIKAEARSTVLAEVEEQVKHMIQRFETAAREAGTTVQIDHRRHYNAYKIPEDAQVIQVAQAAARNLGFDGALRVTLGGSDANIFNAMGIPSIVVATGMDKIHTHDECISRKDLIDTTRLTLEIVRETAKLG